MQIVGHKTQWEFLKRLAHSEIVSQTLLFSGPNSLGKKKVGLEFVKLLNCQEKDFSKRPCQNCYSCSWIEKRKHPDLIWVEPEGREIQISQIRDLKRALSFRPQISKFKAVILNEAERLNPEAQNCLLKVLEEPKGRTLFLLITAHPELLFETIRSRCQILKFYPLSQKEMENYFKGKMSDSQLREALFLAEGRPGRVIEFLENPQKLRESLIALNQIKKLLNSDLLQKFSFSENFFSNEKSPDLNFFLENLERYLRRELLKKLGRENVSDLKEKIEAVEEIKFLVSTTNINPKLALETLMLMI